MKKSKSNVRWIEDAMKKHKDDWDLDVTVTQNGHKKVLFSNSKGERWILTLASTSSDPNVRKKEISLLRTNLKRKFGIKTTNDDFSIQFYVNKINKG